MPEMGEDGEWIVVLSLVGSPFFCSCQTKQTMVRMRITINKTCISEAKNQERQSDHYYRLQSPEVFIISIQDKNLPNL
ncbi:MAG: hypothetical protein EAX86_09420 [Candidatus Heimdallarchaeota archaeon]|nr:hypothetical protein [Candidatus Heimdallarchaeota archaeon]